MRGVCAERNSYADLRIVIEPRPDGPVIGFYAGQPIAASVVDCFGRHFAYRGAAPRRQDGQYDFKALASDEWLVEPGLVYSYSARDDNQMELKSHGENGGRRRHALREALIGWLH
jgi:hypothetical protein